MFALRLAPRSVGSLARCARPLSTAAGSRGVLRASPLPRAKPSSVAQQVRNVRQSPFSRPGASSGPHGPHPGAQGASSNPFSGEAPSNIWAQGGWSRALTSVGIVAGTALGVNFLLNRETRGGLEVFESEYLNSTFSYLGGGLAITAGAAYAMHRTGWSYRIMFANPWLVLGVGVVASIGGMIGAQSLPTSHPLKAPSWLLFNVSQAVALSPLFFLKPAILARAGLYTVGVVGSLCYVGATAKQDQYLYLGGPLLAGVTVVALSSLAPMILPRTAVRTLMATEAISLYGGLAVFGAFVLYDTQRVLREAKMVQAGFRPRDPMAASIGLELDFINIFVRMVQILAMRDQRRR